MTRFLVATASVHVTAAAADYLQDRIELGADEVVVVGVDAPDAPARDLADAANVARARLAAATPTAETREGDVVGELLAAADEHDPDEVVIGTTRGKASGPGVDGTTPTDRKGPSMDERRANADREQPGSTARALLDELDRPVVVVPVPALD
jgi:nucleotide-binding universal stress UspA family protein